MVSAQRDVQDDKNLHYLTLLAIDFICATSDFFGIDTELDVALSAEFSEICDAVLDRHGAHVTGRSPTGVLACFGYPSPSEGDARNALKAALEITEDIGSVRSRGPDHTVISARCGVHTGPVVLHHEAAMGGDFKVTGTACNAAVDLAREAKAGEVLVSVASIGRDQNKFKTAGRRQLAVAGAADPIDVLSVESIRDRSGYDGQDAAAPAASDTAPADGMTPFIGREQEIERLSDLGWQVTEGAQKSIAVVGEPGVGKTRLVREFLATSIPADAMVWQAQCDDYGSAEPLGPVLQILRQMLGLDRAMPADAIVARVTEALGSWGLPTEPHLGTLIGALRPGLSVAEGRRSAQIPDIVQSVISLLQILSSKAVQVLSIDDLQWADQESRQIIDGVCRAEIGQTLIIATMREDHFRAVDRRLFDAVHLKTLPDDDARAFISALAPGISNFDCDQMLESSGCNALYLEELCYSFRHQPMLGAMGKDVSQTVWLEKLVDARVQDLPPREREILGAASVIGYDISRPLLDRLLDQPADDAALDALAARSFLMEGASADVLRFKHGMTRDIIYNTVSWHRRRQLHRQAAEALIDAAGPDGAEAEAERLAYHYKAAEDWEPAARYAEFAGNRASVVSALDQAKTHYMTALDCLTAVGLSSENYAHWLQLSRSLALACVYDPARDQVKLLEKAVSVAGYYGTNREICEARFWAGYVSYALGDAARSLAHLERSMKDAKAGAYKELASHIGAGLGQTYAAASRYDRAVHILDQSIAIKRPLRKPGRPAVSLAYSLACKAAVLGDRGDFADAYACFDEAIDGVRGANHEVEGSVLCWKAGVLLWQGHWQEAKGVAEDAVAVAERVRSLYLLDMGLSLRGFAQWRLTGSASSLAQIERATTRLEAGEKRLFVSLNYGWLAQIRSAQGEHAGLRTAAARAIRRERQMDRLGAAMAHRALAQSEAGTDAGHTAHLERAAATAAERQSRHEVAKTQLLEARLLAESAAYDRQNHLLDQAEAAFSAMDMPWHLAQAAAIRTDRTAVAS